MTVREEHKQKVAGGAEHVLYKGLLAMAHEKWGTKWSMESKILQFPNDGNGHTTICQATLVLEGGQTFVEIGDANPGNVGRNIAPHSIRMASTRAKGRVLRDGLNIGEAMHEEFGGDAEQAPRQQGRSTSPDAGSNAAGSRPRGSGSSKAAPLLSLRTAVETCRRCAARRRRRRGRTRKGRGPTSSARSRPSSGNSSAPTKIRSAGCGPGRRSGRLSTRCPGRKCSTP